jgi:hypothetical protein
MKHRENFGMNEPCCVISGADLGKSFEFGKDCGHQHQVQSKSVSNTKMAKTIAILNHSVSSDTWSKSMLQCAIRVFWHERFMLCKFWC